MYHLFYFAIRFNTRVWAQALVELLRQAQKDETRKVLLEFSPASDLVSEQQRCFNGGYLFLQHIYHELGLGKVSKAISKKHGFQYNRNSILSRLIYAKIIYPSSKLSTFEDSHKFIEQPDFELHRIYRALSVIATESDYIQNSLFKNSMKLFKRKTGIFIMTAPISILKINRQLERAMKAVVNGKSYVESKPHISNHNLKKGSISSDSFVCL